MWTYLRVYRLITGHYYEISYEAIEKLFDGHKFLNLLNFEISTSNLIKIENGLFALRLQNLILYLNEIQILDNDTFTNMKQLITLDLSSNNIE